MNSSYVSISDYRRLGKWSEGPFFRTFGNWSKALAAAGLKRNPNDHRGASFEELLDNLERIWITLGRQPRHSEIKAPLSRFSASTYLNRFGSWRRALDTFIEWVNSDSNTASGQLPEGVEAGSPERATTFRATREPARKRAPRIANLRLKFRVMRRDHFTCRACGRSPCLVPGLVLNVDHVVPWEAGGETVEENLQTLCEACNQGKGKLSWRSGEDSSKIANI